MNHLPTNRIRAVFLDFDGVVVDSMPLKLNAYLAAMEPWELPTAKLRPLQLACAGLSRHYTIRLMHQKLVGGPFSDNDFDSALGRFRTADEANRQKMQLFPGALEFLEWLRDRQIPSAIVTGTPQEVIDVTIDFLNLKPYFRNICGTPPNKPKHLQTLMHQLDLAAQSVLFVGDAVKDQEAAREVGCFFAGIDHGDHPFAPEPLWRSVSALRELIPSLEPLIERHPKNGL